MEQYAVVVDNSNTLHFINLKTFFVDYTLNIDYDIMDVVVSKDNKKAYVTASDPHYLLEIDLDTDEPYLKNALPLPSDAQGIALTPNNQCAVTVNGGSSHIGLTGIQLELGHVFNLHVDAQAVTASTNSRIFIADYLKDRIRLYAISDEGALTNTNQESLNVAITNLGATTDEKFIFTVCSVGHLIQVLDVSSEQYFGVAGEISTKNQPQSMVINKANDKVYVLEENCIEIFSFNPIAKTLSLMNTIEHGMGITPFYGINQIALSPDETLVIFSSTDSVNIYTAEGEFIKKIDITPYGGIATYWSQEIMPIQYDLLVTSGYDLVMMDSKQLVEKGRIRLWDYSSILNTLAVTSDETTAVVTDLYGTKIFQIDLTKNIPEVTHTARTPSPVRCSAITPDNNYAVMNSYKYWLRELYTYNLENQTIKKIETTIWDFAINPSNGDVYGSKIFTDLIEKYHIDDEGQLTYTGQQADGGSSPLAFHPSGNFLFANYESDIAVMDTSSPNYFGVASKAEVMGSGTILVNKAGDMIFVLGGSRISQFAFDTVSKRLTFVNSFEHSLNLYGYFCKPVMIFNEDETELIILTSDSIVKYTTEGEWLNEKELYYPNGLVLVNK